MAIQDERYLLLTTYRRTGSPVSTPVWVVDLGNHEIGFWTSSESGKAKRLAHTARVTVQPSDARGRVKPGTVPLQASARLVTGAEHERIHDKVVAKYGWMTKATPIAAKIGGLLKGKQIPYGDRGVIVTLPPSSGDSAPAAAATH